MPKKVYTKKQKKAKRSWKEGRRLRANLRATAPDLGKFNFFRGLW